MTPSSQDLAALLADIEQAPHGDIGLDLDVMEAVWPTWQKDTITDDARRYVTSSLDAALALCARVLPGWDWEIHGPREMSAPTDDGRPTVILRGRTPALVIGPVCIGTAASPALALLATMLRALLALAGDTSGGVEKIDKSACADSADAPAFGAAGDAQRKSEGGGA